MEEPKTKVVAETDIEREAGFLYCCKGNPIQIVRVKRGKGKHKGE